MIRLVAEQAWPFIINRPRVASATTRSRSASASTSEALFPPSSRCSRRSVGAAASATAIPAPVEPVSEIAAIPSADANAAPTSASPWTSASAASGTPPPISASRTRSIESGASSGGFATTRVAGDQPRRALLDEQLDREVEGQDRGDHPERLVSGDREVVFGAGVSLGREDAPAPPAALGGIAAQQRDRPADLEPGLFDRLARLASEQIGEFIGNPAERVGAALERGGALGHRQASPGPLGGDGRVHHILNGGRGRQRDLPEGLVRVRGRDGQCGQDFEPLSAHCTSAAPLRTEPNRHNPSLAQGRARDLRLDLLDHLVDALQRDVVDEFAIASWRRSSASWSPRIAAAASASPSKIPNEITSSGSLRLRAWYTATTPAGRSSSSSPRAPRLAEVLPPARLQATAAEEHQHRVSSPR